MLWFHKAEWEVYVSALLYFLPFSIHFQYFTIQKQTNKHAFHQQNVRSNVLLNNSSQYGAPTTRNIFRWRLLSKKCIQEKKKKRNGLQFSCAAVVCDDTVGHISYKAPLSYWIGISWKLVWRHLDAQLFYIFMGFAYFIVKWGLCEIMVTVHLLYGRQIVIRLFKWSDNINSIYHMSTLCVK